MNGEEGVKERIRRRILEATDADDLARIRQELKDEGEKPGTIDAVVHELRKKGHLRFDEGKTTFSKMATGKEIIPAMHSFIEEVYVPRPIDGRDGYWDGYEAGTRRARQDLFLSIMALQQLSSLGVQQAQPLVAMAKELRAEVNPYEVAQAASQQTLNSSLPQILSVVKQQATPRSADPWDDMMVRLIEPLMQQMMGTVMGGMMPTGMGQPWSGAPGQPMPGQAAPPPGQPMAGHQGPPAGQPGFQPQPGGNQATEDEVKEAFGDV
jgi:hypothetical protein